MARKRMPQQFRQIAGNGLAEVDPGDLGTNGASQSMLFHGGSIHGGPIHSDPIHSGSGERPVA
jgi:hypothetical protein